MPTARQYSDPLTRNDIGLLVLRVAVGVVLCWNGVEALFGSTTRPPTDLAARVLVGTYTIGGAMLVAGVLTPFGACAVLASMLYMGLHSYSTRYELGLPPDWDTIKFPLMLGLGAVSVILLGSGDISVDGRFGRTEWPTAVSTMLVVAGVGAAIAAWVLVGDTNPFS